MKIFDEIKAYIGKTTLYYTWYSCSMGAQCEVTKVDNTSQALQDWIEKTTGRKYIMLLNCRKFVDAENVVLKPPYKIVKRKGTYDFDNEK